MKSTSIILFGLLLISVVLVMGAGRQQDERDDDKGKAVPTVAPTQPPKKDDKESSEVEEESNEKDDKKETPRPTVAPTVAPTPKKETPRPTVAPTVAPTPKKETPRPTVAPTVAPTPKKETPRPTVAPTVAPPKKDDDKKDDDKEVPLPTATPRCCQCPATPTPRPIETAKPAAPCKLVCQDGFILLKINIPSVHAEGDLAEFLDLDENKEVGSKLSILFKPDFVRAEQSEKPKRFWLDQKGSFCLEVFKEDESNLKFSARGNIADGAQITATLNPTKDQVTIDIRSDDHEIKVILKKGSNGFDDLERVLDMNMEEGASQFNLVADLEAHVFGQKDKDMTLGASKVVSDIRLTKCRAKIAPTVCPACTEAEGCDNIKKAQLNLQDTKEPTHNKTMVIKLDAAWRTCFNRSNTRKSEDFLISLISIRECTSKDQSSCPRSVWDFSNMRITSGQEHGIPERDESVVMEGKVPVQELSGSSRNSVYVRLTLTRRMNSIEISIQLNKGDKFQWLPEGKNNVILFTFKFWGQMAITMMPKSAEKGDVKTIVFEIRDNIKLQSKPGFSQDFVVKTRLNVDFPMKVNGQFLKLKKTEIQQGKATLVTLEFSKYHFSNNMLNYGPIEAELTWKQYTPAAALADTNANAALQAGEDSDDEIIDHESSACSLANWVSLV